MYKKTIIFTLLFLIIFFNFGYSKIVYSKEKVNPLPDNWKTYSNNQYGFKINYPIGSDIETDQIGPAVNINPFDNTVLTITVTNISQSLNNNTLQLQSKSLDDYKNDKIKSLSGEYKINKINQTKINNNDTDGVRIEYQSLTKGDYSDTDLSVLTIKDSRLYEISIVMADTSKAPQQIKTFNQMINSFKFK